MIIQRADGYIHIIEGLKPGTTSELKILDGAEVHVLSRGRWFKDTIAFVKDSHHIHLANRIGEWRLTITMPFGSENYEALFWRKSHENGMELCYLACEYSKQRYDAYHQRRAVAESFIRMRQEVDALSLNMHKATEVYIAKIDGLSKTIRALREDLSKK